MAVRIVSWKFVIFPEGFNKFHLEHCQGAASRADHNQEGVAKIGVIMAKMGLIRGRQPQACHDFWRRQNSSSHWAPMTHSMPLLLRTFENFHSEHCVGHPKADIICVVCFKQVTHNSCCYCYLSIIVRGSSVACTAHALCAYSH